MCLINVKLLLVLVVLVGSISLSSSSSLQFVSIRGGNNIQSLPVNMVMKSFNTFTFNEQTRSLEQVENNLSNKGKWCNLSSF